MTLIVSSWR